MDKKYGKVYLVGAGPGDPGLITFRALELLGSCDAVCYDALIDPTLVATLPIHIEKYYVGKRAGSHAMPQEEIQNLLIKLAKEGKNIVRLKGGDPFIFGRGGEEALALVDEGIQFEIVPGVTAAAAASAYAGIPLTHRAVATWSVLFTAHETPDKSSTQLPLKELGGLKNGTYAAYMGVGRLRQVADEFISGGMDDKTSAAVIEWGTTGRQKVAKGNLSNIDVVVKEQGIKPPGLFITGDVVKMADKLSWFDPGPLAGKRVLVTRPTSQAANMYESLRRLGAEVVPAPSIQIKGVIDKESWQKFAEMIPQGGWIIFTSENGVTYFCDQLLKSGLDWRALGLFRIAVIGAGTERAMQRLGLRPDFKPSKFTTKYLADELPEHITAGQNVVRVRGNLGDDKVEESMRNCGAEVLPMTVYNTSTAPLTEEIQLWVNSNKIDYITFTSGSSITSFIEQWGREKASRIINEAKVATIGPVTSKIVEEEGFEVAIQAERFDIPGVIDAIIKNCK